MTFLTFSSFPALTSAQITVGTAGNFAVLAGSTVTNSGLSIIDGGDIGVSPGGSVTGFGPGVLAPPYVFHIADPTAVQAQSDLSIAYNTAAGLAPTQILTGQDLGGLTLTPGVYFFASSAQLTGILTLDFMGDPDAEFIFQIGSTLTTATSASVITINSEFGGCAVYWQVGSSATIGTATAFQGHILAQTSITLSAGASIADGSTLARNGAVTLDTNTITNCIPTPGSAALVLLGGAAIGRRARKAS